MTFLASLPAAVSTLPGLSLPGTATPGGPDLEGEAPLAFAKLLSETRAAKALAAGLPDAESFVGDSAASGKESIPLVPQHDGGSVPEQGEAEGANAAPPFLPPHGLPIAPPWGPSFKPPLKIETLPPELEAPPISAPGLPGDAEPPHGLPIAPPVGPSLAPPFKPPVQREPLPPQLEVPQPPTTGLPEGGGKPALTRNWPERAPNPLKFETTRGPAPSVDLSNGAETDPSATGQPARLQRDDAGATSAGTGEKAGVTAASPTPVPIANLVPTGTNTQAQTSNGSAAQAPAASLSRAGAAAVTLSQAQTGNARPTEIRLAGRGTTTLTKALADTAGPGATVSPSSTGEPAQRLNPMLREAAEPARQPFGSAAMGADMRARIDGEGTKMPPQAEPAPAPRAPEPAMPLLAVNGVGNPIERLVKEGLAPVQMEALSPLPMAPLPSNTAPVASLPVATEVALHSTPGSAAFTDELSTRLTTLVRGGVEQARLQLNPVEMGPVEVRIRIDGDGAHVLMLAEQAPTRQWLEQAMPSLAGSLRESGLTLAGGGVFDQAQGRPGSDGFAQNPEGGYSRPQRPPTEGPSALPPELPGQMAPRRRGVVDLVA